MPAIDFPSSPAVGQLFNASGKTWIWDGVSWSVQIVSFSAVSSIVPINSPGFTGTPTAPTAAVNTNTTQIATTAYVVGQGYAKTASPTFTGAALFSDGTTTEGRVTSAGDTFYIQSGISNVDTTAKLNIARFNTTTTNISQFNVYSDATAFSGTVSAQLKSPTEFTTVSATAATGTINYDAVTQGVLYYTTNASGNWTMNVRGNSGTTLNSILAVGQSITVVFLNTNGATPYYQTALQVDGAAVTPKWSGGTAPTSGNASSIDAYSFTIIKTANATFTALASSGKYS